MSDKPCTYTKEQADGMAAEMSFLVNGGYIPKKLPTVLANMLKDGRVKSVEFAHFDAGALLWDGTIYVNFARQNIAAFDVVNELLESPRPDEVWFEDKKRLRMWWG